MLHFFFLKKKQFLSCTSAPEAEYLANVLSGSLHLALDTPLDIQGQTLLHLAVVYANPTAVCVLLKAGVDASLKDGYGKTPLERLHASLSNTDLQMRTTAKLIHNLLVLSHLAAAIDIPNGLADHRFTATTDLASEKTAAVMAYLLRNSGVCNKKLVGCYLAFLVNSKLSADAISRLKLFFEGEKVGKLKKKKKNSVCRYIKHTHTNTHIHFYIFIDICQLSIAQRTRLVHLAAAAGSLELLKAIDSAKFYLAATDSDTKNALNYIGSADDEDSERCKSYLHERGKKKKKEEGE